MQHAFKSEKQTIKNITCNYHTNITQYTK